MPTYDYVCQNCGFKFERFQKMSDPPVKKCPECDGKVKRLIGSGAAVVFKSGSGSNIRSDSNSCCGDLTPCDNPKRCCTDK